MPVTSGFIATFGVISAAVEARSFWLAIVAMLSAVISAFVYLRIVLTMYGEDADEGAPRYRIAQGARVALVAAVVATIGLGIIPQPLNELTGTAVTSVSKVPEVTSQPAN